MGDLRCRVQSFDVKKVAETIIIAGFPPVLRDRDGGSGKLPVAVTMRGLFRGRAHPVDPVSVRMR